MSNVICYQLNISYQEHSPQIKLVFVLCDEDVISDDASCVFVLYLVKYLCEPFELLLAVRNPQEHHLEEHENNVFRVLH